MPTLEHTSLGEPRFSRFAIVGAVWALFGLLAIIPTLFFIGLNRVWNGTALPTDIIYEAPPLLFTIFMGELLAIGAGAPIGTTIYGAIAIGHIKRSGGRIIGLPLAVADVLFFPLLVLGGLIAALVARVGFSMAPNPNAVDVTSAGAIGVLVALVVCFFVARAAWRAVAGNHRLDDQLRGPPVATPTEAISSIGIGRISLWAAISGVVLPALLLLGGIVLSSRVTILEGFVALCFLLGVGLELVAVGCGIAARRTPSGKAGLIVGSIALLLWLATLLTVPMRMEEATREPETIFESVTATKSGTSSVAVPTQFDIFRDGNVTYLGGHNSPVVDVAVSADGRSLASADEQGFVIVRRIDETLGHDTPRVIGQFAGKGKPIHRLATSEDGRRFLMAGNLKSPSIVSVPYQDGAIEQMFAPSGGTISQLFAFNSDTMLGYYGTGLTLFDVKARQLVRSVPIYPYQRISHIQSFAVTPDRRHFALTACNFVGNSSAEPHKLIVFNIAGDELFSWQFPDALEWSRAQVVFPTADTLVAYLPNGTIRRWTLDTDANKWHEGTLTLGATAGWFYASAISSNSQTMYLAEQQHTQATAPDGSKYDVPQPPYFVLAVSPTTSKLLWKQELTIGPKKSQENFSAAPINSLTAVPGTNKVAVALWDGRIAIVDQPVP